MTNLLNKAVRYINTLRYLKSVQITDRILRKFRKVRLRDLEVPIRVLFHNWDTFPLLKTSYQGDGKFKFLNETDTVSDWNDITKSKLWLYNLHYFDDLNQSDWEHRKQIHENLINSWIDQNPIMTGNGWEPYPLSLRSVNWIKWFLSGNNPEDSWTSSLLLQAQALEKQLEYHLLGNHLFTNAKALIFLGCYFDGPQARSWLDLGLSILSDEIPEQVLCDGGNFELSPMYHNIILADLLELYHLSCLYDGLIPEEIRDCWRQTIVKMFRWADLMKHPDGEISFFNDAALGIAPKNSVLKEYAAILQISLGPSAPKSVNLLPDSGYIVAIVNKFKLIMDVGKVGPDYIPGHAHADTLSFELSFGDQRVFVNSGTSVYGNGPERHKQRKTLSHNTLVVDGEDSSEVWGGFRVARRANPSVPTVLDDGSTISVECSHDGYMRLPGKVVHSRTWKIGDDKIVVHDALKGTFKTAKAFYYLHPYVRLVSIERSLFALPCGTKFRFSVTGGQIDVQDSTWHPEFGTSYSNKVIVINFSENEAFLVLERIFE